jgi:mannose-6-phosphate isomerase-like protein (cupin superfamily)
MPPGGFFTMSERNRPVYDADGALYVLEGQYTIHMPETGEIRVAEEGETILLRGPHWHFGYNFSDRELRLVETIAPLPSPERVRDLKPPTDVKHGDLTELADFPRTRGASTANMDVVGLHEASNLLLGNQNPALLRVMASNKRLSFGIMDLAAGRRTDAISWNKDASIYVQSGHVHVRIDAEGEWQEIGSDDVFFIPYGMTWQLFNHRGAPSRMLMSLGGNLAEAMT